MLLMLMQHIPSFFFNDTATTEIYTLSLHDALPIYRSRHGVEEDEDAVVIRDHLPDRHRRGGSHRRAGGRGAGDGGADRKSTRLNSSHANISYAVFCLKKKKKWLLLEDLEGYGVAVQ